MIQISSRKLLMLTKCSAIRTNERFMIDMEKRVFSQEAAVVPGINLMYSKQCLEVPQEAVTSADPRKVRACNMH